MVFLVVNEQKGDLEQLIQGSAVQEDDEKRYDDPQFLHVANISENLPQETSAEVLALTGFFGIRKSFSALQTRTRRSAGKFADQLYTLTVLNDVCHIQILRWMVK